MSRHVVPTRKPKYLYGDFTVILIGSKPNYRMKSYGPLSLLKIDGMRLIEKQNQIIRKIAPDAEIILVTGFETDKILKKIPYGIRIIENCRYDETNECEDIRLALNATLHNKVVIINYNLIFSESVLKCITNNQSYIIVDSDKQISLNEIGVTSIDSKPTILSYSIESPKWCRITSFVNKEFNLLKTLCQNRENSRKLLVEILNEILNQENQFLTIQPPNSKVIFFGDSKEIKK